MNRASRGGDGGSRRARATCGVAVATLLGLAAILPALPAGATIDAPADAQIAPWTEPTHLTEDRDTVTSLRPDPVETPPAESVTDAVPTIVFPLAATGSYTASFGAPRDGGTRRHEGIDIFADKLTPVIAVSDGVVTLVRSTIGGDCCVVRLRHEDGSETLYLHLNNDTPGTDDGLGYGIAEGIAVGVSVQAGQVIGFVGDSGNAEDTPPHLHFEYHEPSGAAIDPYVILRVSQGARPADYAAMQEIPTELAFTGVSTLFLVASGFAMVTTGVLMLSFVRCDDLWSD